MSTMSGLHLEQLQEVVEQQRAEIERLTAERDAYHESNERLAAIVSGKNAEIERLQKANAELKQEILDLRGVLRRIQ